MSRQPVIGRRRRIRAYALLFAVPPEVRPPGVVREPAGRPEPRDAARVPRGAALGGEPVPRGAAPGGEPVPRDAALVSPDEPQDEPLVLPDAPQGLPDEPQALRDGPRGLPGEPQALRDELRGLRDGRRAFPDVPRWRAPVWPQSDAPPGCPAWLPPHPVARLERLRPDAPRLRAVPHADQPPACRVWRLPHQPDVPALPPAALPPRRAR